MVCRQNAASSIAIALARSGSWLDDAQVQSIVHRLRHEFSGSQPPAGLEPRHLPRPRTRPGSSTPSPSTPTSVRDRRAGLLRRLDRARTGATGCPTTSSGRCRAYPTVSPRHRPPSTPGSARSPGSRA